MYALYQNSVYSNGISDPSQKFQVYLLLHALQAVHTERVGRHTIRSHTCRLEWQLQACLQAAQKSFVAAAKVVDSAKQLMAAAEHWPQLWPLKHRQLQHWGSWLGGGHCWGERWGGMRQLMKGAHQMQGG